MLKPLLRWSKSHGRNFTWRLWRDPYRLLVAEILLRQTRAEAVARFAPTFFERYPNPATLRHATEAELVNMLVPLGLARQRARDLAMLAATLVGTKIDSTNSGSLRNLPGIGPYSAGMVAAIFGSSEPAVDTNVARVLTRFFGLRPSHSEPRKSENIWNMAQTVVDLAPHPAEITWAILDLAALICRVRSPRCLECPLRRSCAYPANAALGQTAGV